MLCLVYSMFFLVCVPDVGKDQPTNALPVITLTRMSFEGKALLTVDYRIANPGTEAIWVCMQNDEEWDYPVFESRLCPGSGEIVLRVCAFELPPGVCLARPGYSILKRLGPGCEMSTSLFIRFPLCEESPIDRAGRRTGVGLALEQVKSLDLVLGYYQDSVLQASRSGPGDKEYDERPQFRNSDTVFVDWVWVAKNQPAQRTYTLSLCRNGIFAKVETKDDAHDKP